MRVVVLILLLLGWAGLERDAVAANENDKTWVGIGVIVDVAGQKFIVLQVIRGSPAQAAGIREEDAITAIDDQPVAGLSLPEVLDRLRGELNSTVKVTVSRSGTGPLSFSMVRKPITKP